MKHLLSLLAIIIIVVIFMWYGRSIYMPLMHKIKGKETVESRVLKIENDAYRRLEYSLKNAGFIEDFPDELIMIAFKEERILQIYSNNSAGIQFIKEYPFTGYSGHLGPKLKEGDKQIPEGIYKVEYLNPNSSYYLSIKVDYPNDFDKSKSAYSNVSEMGGDIFIHGKSASIGCIPIGDKAIEEVFFLTHKAMNKEVKIIICPRDFRNNSIYPKIDDINWETELYKLIDEELQNYQFPNQTPS